MSIRTLQLRQDVSQGHITEKEGVDADGVDRDGVEREEGAAESICRDRN